MEIPFAEKGRHAVSALVAEFVGSKSRERMAFHVDGLEGGEEDLSEEGGGDSVL